MTVVHQPTQPHTCRIGWKEAPLPETHPLRAQGHTAYLVPDGQSDPPGTIRRCDSCGKTWVGYRQTHALGMRGMHIPTTQWRHEGRLERWRRERRHARQEQP